MSDEPTLILCQRTTASGEVVDGSRRVPCGRCSAECWLARSSEQVYAIPGAQVVCEDCFLKERVSAETHELLVTPEQLRELGAELARRRRKN